MNPRHDSHVLQRIGMSEQQLVKQIGSVEIIEVTPGRHVYAFIDTALRCSHFPPHAVVMRDVPLGDALYTLWYISSTESVYAVHADGIYKILPK